MNTIKDLCKLRILNYSAKLDYEKQDKWQKDCNSYRLQLQYKGKQYSFDFWQGIGITNDPVISDVLECLQSDCSFANYSFIEFCSNLGYDNDSIEALNIYNATQKEIKSLKKLFCNDFEGFMELEF